MASSPVIRIGTRGSPLALKQARMVRDRLMTARGLAEDAIEIRVIRTSGDMNQTRPLADIGGKALFTKEIEDALLRGDIDLAVHSAKDMQTILPDGLVLAACLPREDPRDVFVSPKAKTLAALPHGAKIGTASPRREALVKRMRPDLQAVLLRGNVETRLLKIADGVADATILALAGLKRLGLEGAATAILETDEFLPAAGQGAIAIEARDDDSSRALATTIDDGATTTALIAERAFLAALDGTCKTPIAAHAQVTGDQVSFRGLIVKPDGSVSFETTRIGSIGDARALGADAGLELKARGGPDFFAAG